MAQQASPNVIHIRDPRASPGDELVRAGDEEALVGKLAIDRAQKRITDWSLAGLLKVADDRAIFKGRHEGASGKKEPQLSYERLVPDIRAGRPDPLPTDEKSKNPETTARFPSLKAAKPKEEIPMLTRMIAVCALSIGMATAVMAQQSGSGAAGTGSSGSGNGAGTNSQNGAATSGNGGTGNNTTGTNGTPNSNGQSQDCNAMKTGKNTAQGTDTRSSGQSSDSTSRSNCPQ
jgi:hypothetical protein